MYRFEIGQSARSLVTVKQCAQQVNMFAAGIFVYWITKANGELANSECWTHKTYNYSVQ